MSTSWIFKTACSICVAFIHIASTLLESLRLRTVIPDENPRNVILV